MKQVNINSTGTNVSWGFSTNNLTIGFYRAALLDANNRVIYRWEHQKTADSIPDHFQIPFPASQLTNCVLWVQAIIMDPSYGGRPYTANIRIVQGTVLSDDPYSGTVPAGPGKSDGVTDTVLFV